MIVEKACWERGCACYDHRFDEGVEVAKNPPITLEDVEHLWATIYDHGNGKYRGDVSREQREKAFKIIDNLRNGIVHAL